MDYKSLVGIQSQLEMGELDKRSMNELEDENFLSLEPDAQKTLTSKPEERGSFYLDLQTSGDQMLMDVVFRSIKTVVFSNKLNLLMPFGPLAIVVNKLTDHHGWVFFLCLLGITPLAERLGYATEQLAFYTGPTVCVLFLKCFLGR